MYGRCHGTRTHRTGIRFDTALAGLGSCALADSWLRRAAWPLLLRRRATTPPLSLGRAHRAVADRRVRLRRRRAHPGADVTGGYAGRRIPLLGAHGATHTDFARGAAAAAAGHTGL